MDLLEQILARQAAPGVGDVPIGINDVYETPAGVRPGSFLDNLLKKKKKPFEVMGTDDPKVPAEWGSAPSFGSLVTPGIGGLGNMNPAVTSAPVGPADPNYVEPNAAPAAFLTAGERSLQSLVDPSAADAPRAPMPVGRPREADGGPMEYDDAAGLTPATAGSGAITEASSRGRSPAATPIYRPPEAAAAPEEQSMFGRLGGSLMNGLRNNSSTLLALGAGLAGAPNIGQGISRASAAAIPASEADLKNRTSLQAQAQAYQAMRAANVPPNLALAAMTDPEIKKMVVANYMGDRKAEIKTVKDYLGNESLVAVNPYDLTSKPITGQGTETSGGTAAAAKLEPNYDPATNRDEAFLKALDPVTASGVKDIADGKMPGTGRNLQKLMPLVARYELGFDNTRYQSRQALDKSYFGDGSGMKELVRGNTAIKHGVDLDRAITDLHNFSILPGFLNPLTGAIAKQYSKPYQDALARFHSNAEVYARELDAALNGGKSTVSGQKETRALFDPYASDTTNRAALQDTLEKLQQRLDERESSYRTGMARPKGRTVFDDMITHRAELNKLLGKDTGAGRNGLHEAAGASTPAGAPAKVSSKSEYDALPAGAPYIAPDGSLRTKAR